jgi:hypothetical protein
LSLRRSPESGSHRLWQLCYPPVRSTKRSTEVPVATLSRLSLNLGQLFVRVLRRIGDRSVRPLTHPPARVLNRDNGVCEPRHVTCTPVRYESSGRPAASSAAPRCSAVHQTRANSRTGMCRFPDGIRSKSRTVSSIPQHDPTDCRQFPPPRYFRSPGKAWMSRFAQPPQGRGNVRRRHGGDLREWGVGLGTGCQEQLLRRRREAQWLRRRRAVQRR